MGVIATIAIFVVVLSILVFVHEAGHFIVARIFKVDVEEFGFGFPPRIIGKKIGKTLYSLNWIPVGGFVKIKGAAGDDKEMEHSASDPASFLSKPAYVRIAILIAGITMNLLLAALIFSFSFWYGIQTYPEDIKNGATVIDREILVTAVAEGTSAEQAGLQENDLIREIDGQPVPPSSDLQAYTAAHEGAEMQLLVERDGEAFSATVQSQQYSLEGKEAVGIGIGFGEIVTVRYPWYQAVWLGIKMTAWTVQQIGIALADLATQFFTSGKVSEDLAGPVGIAVLTGQFAQGGFISLLQFSALLSVNLALLNFLPLPALDGGRIIFVLLEVVRRKPVDHHIEAMVHNIGFVILLLLVLLITIRDISRFNILGFFIGG